MTFATLGDRSRPAALLIHGMMCTGKDCEPFGQYLAEDYFVIMPTLDGHGGDGTDLLPVEGEVEKLLRYLRENEIGSLALVQGSSMGAEVALALVKRLTERGSPFSAPSLTAVLFPFSAAVPPVHVPQIPVACRHL